ncbi:MFS sugar transporter-like protein [Patellaria atrata CBS 101060]|uniref:MFS sugar transporter-like protein n=1 Tax=Patellaria atrata CBS 101060 TaxID=1346257 RepID=A0A9P4VSD3_9PEZI|nr:MFS sugar transporter-like protein [Patellaria atrata CBS 101060]
MNPTFKDFFAVKNAGIWAGIVTSMYQVGSVVAIPFVGPAMDYCGRRGGMFIGCMFIVVGTIVQGVTVSNASINQFMGGRFLLGFGVALVASGGPIWILECSHPAYRGIAGAIYNTFWFSGSILASGINRGTITIKGNSSWLIPVWGQIIFVSIISIFIWFLPESPRWLFANNKTEKCKEMLTKYHGEGNPESVWVTLQLREYEQYIELDATDKQFWNYSALWRDRSSRYRISVNVMVSMWGQLAGNSVLSYFLGAVLDTAGYKDSVTQANVNLGMACLQFFFAVFGATQVDRFGRRFLLMFANIGCSIIWVGMTIATSQYASNDTNVSAAKASMSMIFLFGIVYSFGFTPLQALYPVEVLSFEMRAKGMSFSNLAVSAGGLINQFALPVALEKIAWKTYIIFVIWTLFQAATIWKYVPETRNRTLEELDEIFAAKNPVKASLEKKKIAVTTDANIVESKIV